ncbi:MAG: hypothetical protein WCO97_05520 [bacterium]
MDKEEQLKVIDRILELTTNNGKITKKNFLLRCAILLTVNAPDLSPFDSIKDIAEYFGYTEQRIYQIASLFGFQNAPKYKPMISPDGQVYEITNLKEFSKKHKLPHRVLVAIQSKDKNFKTCKGWMLYEDFCEM